jgi:hypothetical protein
MSTTSRRPTRTALLCVLMVAGVAGCTAHGSSGPSGGPEWQKAGADAQTTARDSAECRQAAQDDALRRYPYRASSPTFGGVGAAVGQQSDSNDRAVAEASTFNACMQGRGYKR